MLQHEFLQPLDSNEKRAVRLFTKDFSKSFDRVKRNLLMAKLTQSPLNPWIVNWHVSFLSDRKQRVVCHYTVCDWKDANRGTTQGSVSGPYLFNLTSLSAARIAILLSMLTTLLFLRLCLELKRLELKSISAI